MGCSCAKSPERPQQERKSSRKITQTNSKDFGEIDETASPKGKNEIIVISHESLQDFYKLGKLLGSGGFATVRQATLKSNTKKIYAVKSIAKDKLIGKDYLLLRELTILKQLDHPNIIKFYEIYQDYISYHLVMEHCDGGELLQFILENREAITEGWIKNIMFQLAQALNYLHMRSICHRDIKPQNILLNYSTGAAGIPECKLIDFGLSCLKTTEGNFASKVGTLLYVAPEVLKGIMMKYVISGHQELCYMQCFQEKFLTLLSYFIYQFQIFQQNLNQKQRRAVQISKSREIRLEQFILIQQTKQSQQQWLFLLEKYA